MHARAWIVAGIVTALAAGCLEIGAGTGSTQDVPPAPGPDAGVGTMTGIGCGADPNTGAVLCLGVTACPGLFVDGESLPMCGFRVTGSLLDLECVCGDSLCPVGIVATCGEAQSLILSSNTGTVCAQLADGVSCTLIPPPVTAASSTSSSGGGTCDPACASSCSNDPGCLLICGC
jgi:hypothetical protein